MFKQIILGAVLVVLSYVNALTLEDLQNKLGHSVTYADFKQIRSLKGMKNPIVSSGNVIISREHGLYWQQVAPFKVTLILTDNRLLQAIEGGKAEIITAKQNPQLFQFNQLLSAFFTMDIKTIDKSFDLSISEHKNVWQVTLKPKAEPFNKIFKEITLKGQNYINEVELKDQQGDTTFIEFSHQTTEDVLPSIDLERFTF